MVFGVICVLVDDIFVRNISCLSYAAYAVVEL